MLKINEVAGQINDILLNCVEYCYSKKICYRQQTIVAIIRLQHIYISIDKLCSRSIQLQKLTAEESKDKHISVSVSEFIIYH